MKRYEIKYQYATYSGVEIIYAESQAEAIRKMWLKLRPYMTLPMAYQSATVIREETVDG